MVNIYISYEMVDQKALKVLVIYTCNYNCKT